MVIEKGVRYKLSRGIVVEWDGEAPEKHTNGYTWYSTKCGRRFTVDEVEHSFGGCNPPVGIISEVSEKPQEKETNPDYYKSNGVELIDLIENLNFNRGSAVKYLVRAGKKDDEVLDLKKALYYIERELKRIER